jgi:hypothetical protein
MNELQQRIFSPGIQDTSESDADRRREPRTLSDRPVYVQPAALSDARFEEVRTMKDFSRSGFYFITERKSYRQGMQLYVIPAFGCFNMEYIGKVVRIEQLPFGDYGVAVQLLRIGNAVTNVSTVAKSVFQSFALAENIPPASPEHDSDS